MRGLLIAVLGLGVLLGTPGEMRDPGFGISSAEAREYYTRKRINGEWVTGRWRYQNPQRAAKIPLPPKRPKMLALAPPAVISVTLSIADGLKTTFYENGNIEVESFDPIFYNKWDEDERFLHLRRALLRKGRQMFETHMASR